MSLFGGMDIILDINMVDTVEDWSGVRSPGRARRRRYKHPQRIKITHPPKNEIYQIGRKLVMHPATLAKMQAQIADTTRSPERVPVKTFK